MDLGTPIVAGVAEDGQKALALAEAEHRGGRAFVLNIGKCEIQVLGSFGLLPPSPHHCVAVEVHQLGLRSLSDKYVGGVGAGGVQVAYAVDSTASGARRDFGVH